MRLLATVALLLLPALAQAQVNRCNIDGQLSWQSSPCPPGTAITGTPAPAEPATPEERTMYDQCSEWSDLANRIMAARQEGVPMSTMMGIAQGNNELEKVVIDAYETPRFQTSGSQQRIVSDFTDRHYLNCIRIFRATE